MMTNKSDVWADVLIYTVVVEGWDLIGKRESLGSFG